MVVGCIGTDGDEAALVLFAPSGTAPGFDRILKYAGTK